MKKQTNLYISPDVAEPSSEQTIISTKKTFRKNAR